MKKGCFVLLILIFAKSILSQNSKVGFNIVISPLLVSKTSLQSPSALPPPNKLELPYGYGFYLGFMFKNSFQSEKSELSIGCLLKRKAYKISLNVEGNYQNTSTVTWLGNYDNYKKTTGTASICIPVTYSYLFKRKQLIFSPNLGCSLDILFQKRDPNDPFSLVGGNDTSFRFNNFDYTPQPFNISLQTGFSVGRILKNNNALKVGLSFNYGLLNEREGVLRIVIKNKEYKNFITYKGHYIAIELIYSLSRKEKTK